MLENRKIACCGALYLVDQHQNPDRQVTRREQTKMIRKHLRTHAYLDRSKRPISAKAFRRIRGDIASENGIFAQALEDRSAALWRVKSDGLQREKLELYGYERDSFDASRLPRATRDTTVSISDCESEAIEHEPMPGHVQHGPIRRSVLTVLTDIDAVKKDCDHKQYKYADKQSRIRALRLLIHEYALTYRNKDRILGPVTDIYLLGAVESTLAHAQGKSNKTRTAEVLWRTGTDHLSKSWLSVAEVNGTNFADEQDLPKPGTTPKVSLTWEVDKNLSGHGLDGVDLSRDSQSFTTPGPSKKRKARTHSLDRGESSRYKRGSAATPLREVQRLRLPPTSYAEASQSSEDEDPGSNDKKSDRLNVKPSSGNDTAGALAALSRSLQIVLQDIDQVAAHHEDQDYKYASKASRLQALELLIRQYSLTTKNPGDHTRIVKPTALQLDRSIGNTYRSHALTVRAPGTSVRGLWNQGSVILKQSRLDRMERQATDFAKIRGLPAYGAFPTVSRRQEVTEALQKWDATVEPRDATEVTEAPSVQGADTALNLQSPTNRSIVSEQKGPAHHVDSNEQLPEREHATQPTASTASLSTHLDQLLATIQRSVTTTLQDLQLFANQPTPTPKTSNKAMDELFQHCWGPQWRNVCPDLGRNDLLSAASTLKALICAFVHHKLLHKDLAWPRDICLERIIFGLTSTDPSKTQQAHQDLQTLFAQTIENADGAPQHPVIRDFTAENTADLKAVLEPYCESLLLLATALKTDLEVGDVAALREGSTDRAADICARAMDLRVAAMKAAAEYEFLWPVVGHGGSVQREGVEVVGSGEVAEMAYTMAPGLRVRCEKGGENGR
ncbi:hypothetical protein CLAFUW4_07494 [Fulvia fulva]|uniref:Uncharacterized protein n=1 Tax=Passalora fulva TaxID=5499 RepID=A0A9Q8PBH9_PASFU|nr:uncharacterized protein CLAFUR5_07624 [Fulvia fulva]UJO19380.1 hypothetical protein CLAFUR5_07624 [Fulvia fulva]WPV16569.1 hypothetical protein CLAFUW4_07494 [Fulvia fulva]WPV30765.1 hypothetical protein CLAFUW7_07496 [Fulvia fulva]